MSAAILVVKTKIIWPNDEILNNMVEELGYLQVGKKLGVSDNAVRKRIKKVNKI